VRGGAASGERRHHGKSIIPDCIYERSEVEKRGRHFPGGQFSNEPIGWFGTGCRVGDSAAHGLQIG
jgi:hypothetical protein